MTPNQSHGHVTPNADGYLARCGGPKICKVCLAELAQLRAKSAPAEPSREAVEVVCITQGGCNVTWTASKELTPAGTALMSVNQHHRIMSDVRANRDAVLKVMQARKLLPKCAPSPDAELVALLQDASQWFADRDIDINLARDIDAKLASL